MQRKTILTKEISLNYNILVFELSKPPTFYKMQCFGSLMNIDKLIRCWGLQESASRFGSLMNIDKLIHACVLSVTDCGFGSLMNIDELIQNEKRSRVYGSFGSLMNIDKLIRGLVSLIT